MNHRQQVGKSFSRANSLRPLHATLRSYYAASTALGLSIGGSILLATAGSLFDGQWNMDEIGATALGIGFLLLGVMSLTLLLADCLRRWSLSSISRSRLRGRLRSQPRAHRYQADPRQLKGTVIGALFFCACFLFALVVRLAGIAPGW
ncbi:hypothetical protein [Posidoniimonas corsicana]|uniref:hypothetical protein n=1 Tax=Posidoniimonas corsicana TaxID=1938618 RepID=UPI0011B4AB68|nr:hypothetical protein [Posidoniimonas corsicana]